MGDATTHSSNTSIGSLGLVGGGVSGELLSRKLFRICLEIQKDFERQMRGIQNIEKLKLAQLLLEFEAMNHRKDKLDRARTKLIRRKQELNDMGFHSEGDLLRFQVHPNLDSRPLLPLLAENSACEKCSLVKINDFACSEVNGVFPVTRHATSDVSTCRKTVGYSNRPDDIIDNCRYGKKLLRRRRQGEQEVEEIEPSDRAAGMVRHVYIKARPRPVTVDATKSKDDTFASNGTNCSQKRIHKRLLEDLEIRRHQLNKRVLAFWTPERLNIKGNRVVMRMQSAPP